MKQTAREAAYLAVDASLKSQSFASETLKNCLEKGKISADDYRLAQEITYGSLRMALALDYSAKQLTSRGQLKLKRAEKALVRTALYQQIFMDRIPLYATVNESVTLAKRYHSTHFAKFLNALLRKLESVKPSLPKGDSPSSLSIRESFPEFFVEALIKDYGLESAKEVLAASNKAAPTMLRLRDDSSLATSLSKIEQSLIPMALIEDKSAIETLSQSKAFYIQNITPASLFYELAKGMASPPKRILDLCASPGGKTIAAHDYFPAAELYANDVSPEKLERLQENCDKYGLDVHLSCSPGQLLDSKILFDLIIVDAPCSNSGVLNKRAEARWRLTKENQTALHSLQLELISHAKGMLAPGGEIWYMTCSILKDENEKLIQEACHLYDLVESRPSKTYLPNNKGFDGGFAQSLRNSLSI